MAQFADIYLPDDLYYNRTEHLWARVEPGNRVRVGLDAFGSRAAGTVVYIKILPAGKKTRKNRNFGSLEAGKYVGPLKSPVDGTVVEVNQEVLNRPGRVNEEPYEAWFVVIETAGDPVEQLGDHVAGGEIQSWLEEEYARYQEQGLFAAE
jgi:glycine cleavage system H protein